MSHQDGSSLLFIICENGLGHFKRSIEIASIVSLKKIVSEIYIVCVDWQLQAMKDWGCLHLLLVNPKVHFNTELLSPSIKIDIIENIDEEVFDWAKRIDERLNLSGYDLVISDNLTGILNYRKDSVILGSFLWYEVFEKMSEKESLIPLVLSEKELLSKIRPRMICIDEMATKGVTRFTDKIAVNWMCSTSLPLETKNCSENIENIALLFGRSAVSEKLYQLIITNIRDEKYHIFVPSAYERFSNKQVSVFDFDKDFYKLDIAIIRPGMGTINECVRFNIPMLCIVENRNFEMEHNAKKLEDLNIARSVSIDAVEDRLLVDLFKFDFEFRNQAKIIMASYKKDGLEQASEWILKQLN